MATLTTWEAEKRGYFQGTATPGQAIGRFIDWMLSQIGKLPKLPNVERNKDHWKTWQQGQPMTVTDAWISKKIEEFKLPTRDQVTYTGARADTAQMRAMEGSHVIVEMLDTDRKTRHQCLIHGNVLVATREGWDASLK